LPRRGLFAPFHPARNGKKTGQHFMTVYTRNSFARISFITWLPNVTVISFARGTGRPLGHAPTNLPWR
jgi:hypothetical protein